MITSHLTNIYDAAYSRFPSQKDDRIYHLGQAAINLISGVADFCIGLGAATLAIGTLGRIRKLNLFTNDELSCGSHVLTRTYRSFMQSINPAAKYHTIEKILIGGTYLTPKRHWVTMNDDGIANERFTSYFFNKINVNVSSARSRRKLRALVSIASAITIIVDFPFALIGALGAALSRGNNKTLNTIGASHGLDPLSPIPRIFQGIILLLNHNGF